jgi:hypothetical protein
MILCYIIRIKLSVFSGVLEYTVFSYMFYNIVICIYIYSIQFYYVALWLFNIAMENHHF